MDASGASSAIILTIAIRNCPIDFKEAIASIIFASPRCANIPELVDVRKHITARYGKEFVTAAMELHPECGVNQILVEKLSTIAPDGPTKVRIMTTIANEHNIKWESDWLKDRDEGPPGDLLVYVVGLDLEGRNSCIQ
ncbi:hypothetical protein Ancab_025875 [Ancistrocladus abbreviatus]